MRVCHLSLNPTGGWGWAPTGGCFEEKNKVHLKSLIRLPYFGPHGPLSRKDFDLCTEMNLAVGGIDI